MYLHISQIGWIAENVGAIRELPIIESCINVSCTSSPEASRYILTELRVEHVKTSKILRQIQIVEATYRRTWSYSTTSINQICCNLKILPDILRKQHRSDKFDEISYQTMNEKMSKNISAIFEYSLNDRST